MQIIDTHLLNNVCKQAEENPRLRMNYNFHEQLEAPSQRLLNAMQVGSEFVVHRHLHTPETYILLRGKLKVIYYNENKEITETVILDTLQGKYGINIPAGQFHNIEVLEKDTVIFEVKDGPYKPLEENDILVL